MDFVERLSSDDAEGATLSALEHTHRYEFAARLCAGMRAVDLACGTGYGSSMLAESASAVLGVDLDPGAIQDARKRFGAEGDELEFEVADAAAFLGQDDLAERFDAIVMFEGLEHVEAPAAVLEALAGHARRGVRVVFSVPNDVAFASDNPFHVSHFGFQDLPDLLRHFTDPALLYQFCAQGSLIRGEEPGELEPTVGLGDEGSLEDANNFLVCVGFGDDEAIASVQARMRLTVEPENNSYLRTLRTANRELWRTNAKLAGERVAKSDSAAASTLAKMAALQAEIDAITATRTWRWSRAARRPLAFLRGPYHRVKPRLRAFLLRLLR